MLFRPIAKIIFFISVILVCLLLASCSADGIKSAQPAANEQSAAFARSPEPEQVYVSDTAQANTTPVPSNISADGPGTAIAGTSYASADVITSSAAVASGAVAEVTSAAAVDAANQADAISERRKDKVVKTWEDYTATKMPLLAAIPEKDIYLYGIESEDAESDGGITVKVRLYVGEQKQDLNWNYLTPRFILPELQSYDYDKDGEDEVSVDLYIGSGTGVSVEELHIVEIAGKQMIDHVFDDYGSQLRKLVSFKTFTKAGELMGRITVGQRLYDVSLKDYQSAEYGKINNNLVMESIVRFNSEKGKIIAEFGVGITSDTFVSAAYIGTLHTDVSYMDGRFKLKNARFLTTP